MTFGEDPGGIGSSVEEPEKILETYLDLGGNFIDTANFYTNGYSEKILGDWFAAHRGQREHVAVAWKFFSSLFPATRMAAAQAARRSSPSCTKHCAA